MAASLATAIDADPQILATSAGATITLTAATVGQAGNSITLSTSTTSTTATITASGTTLSGGRNINTLTQNGVVRFRSQEMIDINNPVPATVTRSRSVTVTAGMSILEVVLAIANDIATFSATSRILGALRAPTKFVITGTPTNAPGLTIVPYTRDAIHYNVVFDMLEVPSDVNFAALPSTLMPDPTGIFDNNPKSLVIPAKYYAPSSANDTRQNPSSATDKGKIYIAEPKISSRIQNAFDAIKRMNEDL